MKKTSLIVLCSLALGSCGENLEKSYGEAIGKYLDKKGRLCTHLFYDFADNRSFRVSRHNTKSKMIMDVLEKLRLVSKIAEEKDRDVPGGLWTEVGYADYIFTKEGEKYKKSPNNYSLCYGQMRVDKIVKWQEPQVSNGIKATEVSYLYKIEFDEWAKNAEVQALPEIKNVIDDAGNKQLKHTLKLMNTGWEAVGIDDDKPFEWPK